MTLMLHSGTESATMNELISIPLPQKTRTYQPVPHEQLSTMLLQMVASIFPDFSYEKSHFGLAAEETRCLGFTLFGLWILPWAYQLDFAIVMIEVCQLELQLVHPFSFVTTW